MQPQYKRKKPTTVQLTSLLDLLFVMVFVSLLQQKTPISEPSKKPVEKSVAQPVKKTKVKTPTVSNRTSFDIEATFEFYGTTNNPNLPKGKYLMRGVFDEKTRELKLAGISWIDRPKNYDMVPLSGKIGTSGKTFTGRIEFPSCKQFTLERISNVGADNISGEWKGSYQCGQGSTGLTLNIL
jgi:hypothetical protein